MDSVSNNLILLTDSYKVSHHVQYPPSTKLVYSYFESRGSISPICSVLDNSKYEFSIFFGLQWLLKKYFIGQVVTQDKIDEASSFFHRHFGSNDLFNKSGWEHILHCHNGHLPIKIKAVPEGSVVPLSHILMSVENTCERCFWLTNYIETVLVQLWYPITIATNSAYCRLVLSSFDTDHRLFNNEFTEFSLHNFGFRGSSSIESAAISDAAHLLSFSGTDTLCGPKLIDTYYSSDVLYGFSIPAAEHSTITSWPKEFDAFKNMLNQYTTTPVAIVSDSFNIFKAVGDFFCSDEIVDIIHRRQFPVIIRPDSGDPLEVLPKIFDLLYTKYGVMTSSNKQSLHPNIKVIQGDGISLSTIYQICLKLNELNWDVTRILSFGSGGALIQKFNRDTLKFAFKCSLLGTREDELDSCELTSCEIQSNLEYREVFKSPITDDVKKSKKGRLSLLRDIDNNIHIKHNNTHWPSCEWQCQFKTVENMEQKSCKDESILQTVYENGKLLIDEDFGIIRQRMRTTFE